MRLPARESRTRAIALAAVAAAACLSLSSPPSDLLESVGLVHRMLKLMPQKEVVRYVRKNPPPTATGGGDGSADPPVWYEDMDYHQSGLCGGRKCFFLSEVDQSRGYLIENAVFEDIDGYDEAVRAYEYAKMLEEEHGIRHFNAGAPFTEETPPYFKDHLWGPYKDFYKGAETLIVQPSMTAPEGSVVIRCYEERVLFGRLEYILEDMDPAAKANLAKELEETIPIVAAHPELIQDFQLMIDAQGRIYHLDFDRVKVGEKLREKYTKPFEGCLEGAVEYVKMDMTEHVAEDVTKNE